jgi:predicted pyridoxine 5'-phosphate oxidase superfamily flavin-nucleotide-binding protein
MKLSEYFEKATGLGVMATSDSAGAVNAAVYAKPHFIDEETIAFIMADKLTHHNVQQNPRAAYLFREAGEKYVGKRLYLRKTKEIQDPQLVSEMRRKKYPEVSEKYTNENKFIVYFKIDKVLQLLGDKEG